MKNKIEIGIIGFGQLGQFIAKNLKQHFEVYATDIIDRTKEAKELGVQIRDLKETSSKDIVIISVQINKFSLTLEKVLENLKPGAILMDVCSVKMMPCELMKKINRKDIELIGTHPLFGPQSGANGIEGLKIILCPIRTTKLERIKEFLEKELKLKVIISTPEEHDKEMATAACLSHFIGRSLINIKIHEQEISEPSFNNLLNLKKMLEEDSIELFKDIQINNPFTSEIRENFLKTAEEINTQLNEKLGGK